nr:Uncharacterised protein [Klebsiella pneumoniae]
MLIARQQGSPLLGAINYVIRRSALPLLGATIIAILAFAPIGLSGTLPGSIANRCSGAADLLMLSWFSALTITRCLLSGGCLKRPVGRRRGGKGRSLPRQLYRGYQQALRILLQQRP